MFDFLRAGVLLFALPFLFKSTFFRIIYDVARVSDSQSDQRAWTLVRWFWDRQIIDDPRLWAFDGWFWFFFALIAGVLTRCYATNATMIAQVRAIEQRHRLDQIMARSVDASRSRDERVA